MLWLSLTNINLIWDQFHLLIFQIQDFVIHKIHKNKTLIHQFIFSSFHMFWTHKFHSMTLHKILNSRALKHFSHKLFLDKILIFSEIEILKKSRIYVSNFKRNSFRSISEIFFWFSLSFSFERLFFLMTRINTFC